MAKANAKAPQNWAKMSADLDSHPKVRRAGRLGREVFLFALRRNSARAGTGVVPASDLEPWYVADLLQMGQDDAREGLERSIAAGLIDRAEGGYAIHGWDDEWAKRPMTPAERQALKRSRESHSASVTRHEAVVTERDHGESESHTSESSEPTASVTRHEAVVTERDRHALEKSREEEISASAPRTHAIHIGSTEHQPPPIPEPTMKAPRGTPAPEVAVPIAGSSAARMGTAELGGWSKLAHDLWAFAGKRYCELIAEGVDPKANPDVWNGLPRPILTERTIAMREAGLTVEQAYRRFVGAVETQAANARKKRTLRWLVPAEFLHRDSFDRDADATAAQVSSPSATPSRQASSDEYRLVGPQRAPGDDEPRFSDAERAAVRASIATPRMTPEERQARLAAMVAGSKAP